MTDKPLGSAASPATERGDALPVAATESTLIERVPLVAVPETLARAIERERAMATSFTFAAFELDDCGLLSRALGAEQFGILYEALRRALRGSVRGTDTVVTLEPGCCGIVLRGAGRSSARTVGERLLELVACREWVPEGELLVPSALTAGAGLASWPEDARSTSALVERAREALFDAQRLGHHRIWNFARRPRVVAEGPVFRDDAAAPFGRLRDLSISGLFVETEDTPDEGSQIVLRFALPDSGLIVVPGRVARVGDLVPGLGVSFDRGYPHARALIGRYVERLVDAD